MNAQTHQISGTVTDDRGAPAAGVTVQVKGGRAVQTDAKGHFTIPVTGSGNVSLTLSSVGFKPVTITADSSKEMSIQMERDATTLQEVVIGYQTVPRSKVSGSVSSLAGRQIKMYPCHPQPKPCKAGLPGYRLLHRRARPVPISSCGFAAAVPLRRTTLLYIL